MDTRPIDANVLEALFNKQIELGATDAFGAFDDALQDTPMLHCEECPNYDAAFDCQQNCTNQPTLSLNVLRDEIYQDAVAHGLWEYEDSRFESDFGNEPDSMKSIMRRSCYSELVKDEAEELDDASNDESLFTEELADVIIMSLSVAGKLDIDIDEAVRRKMAVNKERPWKHGKE